MSRAVMQQALTDMKDLEHTISALTGGKLSRLGNAIERLEAALAEPEQPVAVKQMLRWVEHLKRLSDDGQHMSIPGLSSGACWELAIELEQFIKNTAPTPRKPQYDKTEMNKFVQDLFDQKMREGKHGYYETLFHVVHKAIERANGTGDSHGS